jgi:hypothetical protein
VCEDRASATDGSRRRPKDGGARTEEKMRIYEDIKRGHGKIEGKNAQGKEGARDIKRRLKEIREGRLLRGTELGRRSKVVTIIIIQSARLEALLACV